MCHAKCVVKGAPMMRTFKGLWGSAAPANAGDFANSGAAFPNAGASMGAWHRYLQSHQMLVIVA